MDSTSLRNYIEQKANEQESMIARYLHLHPELTIEDIELVEVRTEFNFRFFVQPKPKVDSDV